MDGVTSPQSSLLTAAKITFSFEVTAQFTSEATHV
jgi:hypothetical protein